VVTAPLVRRVLASSGLDRLVSIYPSLEAAAAPRPAAAVLELPGRVPAGGHALPGGPVRTTGQHRQLGPADGLGAAMTPAAVRVPLAALDDGVALAGSDGILALASRRLEEMFGYQRDELAGRPVESLIPAHLQSAHRRHRAGYSQAPSIRPMGAGARLVGLRKDGTTFPVEVSLAPLPTEARRFTIAVVRDLAETRRAGDLADAAPAAAAAGQEQRGQELLDRIVHNHAPGGPAPSCAAGPRSVMRNPLAGGRARHGERPGSIPMRPAAQARQDAGGVPARAAVRADPSLS
jgi:PAS domain S-box-containing protein